MQDPKVFRWPVRVYHEDVDTMGIVYYANYLRYLERARTEWLRQIGVDQKQLYAEMGLWLVVRSVDLDYRLSARLDDWLEVATRIGEMTKTSIVLEQTIRREEQWLLVARIRIVCVRQREIGSGEAQLRPAAIPSVLSEAWKAYL